jgi:hypothetical protein
MSQSSLPFRPKKPRPIKSVTKPRPMKPKPKPGLVAVRGHYRKKPIR